MLTANLYPQAISLDADAASLPLTTSLQIDLSTQTGKLVKDGVVKTNFPISSGILSAKTPTGVTKVVNKGSVDGKSTTRHSKEFGVDMPHAMELDFRDDDGNLRGICIHGGNLPGYPNSRACIRVEDNTAKFLYQECPLGTRVSISGSTSVFYAEHFKRKDLLVIDDEDISFKRNSDGTLTKEFLKACKEHVIKLCRLRPGSDTEYTEDKSKWVLGFEFMAREKCVPVPEYEKQTGLTLRLRKK